MRTFIELHDFSDNKLFCLNTASIAWFEADKNGTRLYFQAQNNNNYFHSVHCRESYATVKDLMNID